MKHTVATVTLRVIGTLVGALGLGMLCIAPFHFYHAIAERNPWTILFAVFPLALCVYLIWVAYLVWFRFSPIAVRHICGTLGFSVLALSTMLFDPAHDSDAAWPAFAFLGCLVAVYSGYRFASDRLSRLLFPESITGVHT